MSELEYLEALSFLAANMKRNATDNQTTSCSGVIQQYLLQIQDEISLHGSYYGQIQPKLYS